MAEIEVGDDSGRTLDTAVVGADASAWLRAIAIQRCRASFAQLFLSFAPRLKSQLLRQGMSATVAEEVVQETLLTVWRKAEQFDPARASAEAWIYAVARNQRIDTLRREGRHKRAPPHEPEEPVCTPEQEIKTIQEGHHVRAALSDLPDEQADLVRRSYFDEHSHSRIADDLGIPLGTVKSRLRNASHRLRLRLGDVITAS